jgi:ubiquinone/menaquinone biosynthesis C-methylase UbiE
VDVGAGDGGYVLHRVRTEPTTFAIAIDASPDALASGAWRAKRAHVANAAFLVEGVECLPRELACIADEVTIHFPWGSLLGGLVAGSDAVVGPIARILKPSGELRVLLSTIERDGMGEVTPALVIARSRAYADQGLRLVESDWATTAIVAASRSAWAKRLAVGRARRAVSARYRREAI